MGQVCASSFHLLRNFAVGKESTQNPAFPTTLPRVRDNTETRGAPGMELELHAGNSVSSRLETSQLCHRSHSEAARLQSTCTLLGEPRPARRRCVYRPKTRARRVYRCLRRCSLRRLVLLGWHG